MHHRSAILITLAAALLLLAPLRVNRAESDENLWGYVYGTDTLPAGQNEIYLWTTSRNQKGKGNYRAWDTSLELEHGFTDHVVTDVEFDHVRHGEQSLGVLVVQAVAGVDLQAELVRLF